MKRLILLFITIHFSQFATAKTMSEVLLSSPSAGNLTGFAKPEHYFRGGGVQPTKEALAEDPRSFFRHEAAYQVFKKGFEIHMGRSYNDNQFKRLLKSNKVVSTNCNDKRFNPTGRFGTTGVDRSGKVSWFGRSCASGEKILVLKVPDGFKTKLVPVAALGCLNLVNSTIIKTPPRTPLIMENCENGCTPYNPPNDTNPPTGTPPTVTPPTTEVTRCRGQGCNNGWGNGDQDAPGGSLNHNGAENDQSDRRSDPSHGRNAGGSGDRGKSSESRGQGRGISR